MEGGEVLWSRGETAGPIALVLQGAVTAERGSLRKVSVGQFVDPHLAFLGEVRRPVTWTAEGPTRLLIMEPSGVWAMRASTNPIYDLLVEHATRRQAHLLHATYKRASVQRAGRHDAPKRPRRSPWVSMMRAMKGTRDAPALDDALAKQVSLKKREVLRKHLDVFTPRPFSAGEMLYAQGDPSDGAWILVSGAVKTMCEAKKGRAHRLYASRRPGDMIGLTGLFKGGPRPVSAVAEGDGWAYHITREKWRMLPARARRMWSEHALGILNTEERRMEIFLGELPPGHRVDVPAGADGVRVNGLAMEMRITEEELAAVEVVHSDQDMERLRSYKSKRRAG